MKHWATDRKNVPASIKARLLKLSKEEGETFQMLLSKFVIERFLYRLSLSPYAKTLTIKGAWLFQVWDLPRRPTRDLDFRGSGPNSPEALREIVIDILQIAVAPPDGLRFDMSTIKATELQVESTYTGVRIQFTAFLENTRIPAQLDFGFGDALILPPSTPNVSPLLEYPSYEISAYYPEASLAEKLEAIVKLSILNSRVKDYHDLYTLLTNQSFSSDILEQQIAQTFKHRGTSIPSNIPPGLTKEFVAATQKQWNLWLDRNSLAPGPTSFANVVEKIKSFSEPLFKAIEQATALNSTWTPSAGWQENRDE